MSAIGCQINSLTVVYSTVYSGADKKKHQSSASLAFVRGIHRWPGNSPHKWPVTRKIFPFDDVTICTNQLAWLQCVRLVRNLYTPDIDLVAWQNKTASIRNNRESIIVYIGIFFRCHVFQRYHSTMCHHLHDIHMEFSFHWIHYSLWCFLPFLKK